MIDWIINYLRGQEKAADNAAGTAFNNADWAKQKEQEAVQIAIADTLTFIKNNSEE